MKFRFKLLSWLSLVVVFTHAPWAGAAGDPVGRQLRQLAARATRTDAWPPLRRFAASTQDPERRGLAYFVLGFREYEAGEYTAAAVDLRDAAATRFSLADYSEYYSAAAAETGGQPGRVIEALEGFAVRHPRSALRLRCLELLAQAILETAQPERALQALLAEPRVHQIPSLALLVAQAFSKAQKFEEAARNFQEVYYSFPTAPESNVASGSLRELESQLGANFPPAREEAQTARAEILFNKSHYDEAMTEYNALLRSQPTSTFAERWQLGRARCLLRLKRAAEAIQALRALGSKDPEADAERLEMLVEAEAQDGDQDHMLQELDKLRELYPQSASYTSALSLAASFFARRADWESAGRYARLLAVLFPQTNLGREGNWRTAWADYLTGQHDGAREGFIDHVTRYPASPHIPAALYWLGRLAEERKETLDARTLYEFLKKRFVHSYYAYLASLRLKGLPPGAPAKKNAAAALQPSPVANLTQIIPPLGPLPVQPCAPAPSNNDLGPYLRLKALSLDSLAEQFLDAELSERPTDLEMLFTLSRAKAQERDFSVALMSAVKLVPSYSEYGFPQLTAEIWDMLFPRAFRKLIERQARANRLDPYLVMGLIRQESAFDPNATSRANARGLMQVLPQTASPTGRRRTAVAQKLYDPAYNVRLGCRYLRRLLEMYQGSLEQALAAYNAGEPRVDIWLDGRQFREPGEFLESIPFRETRVYVEEVLRDSQIYRQLMTGSVKFKKCPRHAGANFNPSF